MIRLGPISTLASSSAASDVYKRQDRKHVGAATETGDRDKRFGVIVRQFVEPRIDRVRQRDDEQRISVRFRLGGDVRTDRSAGAAAIVDIDLLAQLLAQMTSDETANHVVAAARRERNLSLIHISEPTRLLSISYA